MRVLDRIEIDPAVRAVVIMRERAGIDAIRAFPSASAVGVVTGKAADRNNGVQDLAFTRSR
jgi:hypothetical protein